MTRARRIAAIALCAGLAVGIAGQMHGNLDLPQVIGLHQGTEAGSGQGSKNQAASSLPRLGQHSARLGAAQDLLSARAAAVKARDKSSWMGTVDLRPSSFRGRQSVAFDNLIKLPLGQFSYGAARPAPALTPARAAQVGPKAWAVTVTVTYSLQGLDRAPHSFEATYTLAYRAGGWRIADDTDGDAAMQMWDLPGMRVLKGTFGIVVGNAPQSRMQEYATIADLAVRRVSRVWGTDWSSHVVIVTPSTSEQFARLLSRASDKGLDQVAAITQGVIDPGQRAQGDQVVINPKTFTALQPLGLREIITHELTHVAARSSTTSPVPLWLTEGMADYVGYSGLGLPRARVASELLALVRAGKGPTALPDEGDFDPARTTIAPSYSEAWLAVSRLVDLYGQDKVVSFYRAVASVPTPPGGVQPDPDATAALDFARIFGVSEAQFVDGWKGYLRALASTEE
jgi:hypothetical protein